MLVYAARLVLLDHAANVQDRVVDLADLEDVPAAGNEVADVHVVVADKVSDRLALLVDKLVPEGLCGALHTEQPIAAG